MQALRLIKVMQRFSTTQDLFPSNCYYSLKPIMYEIDKRSLNGQNDALVDFQNFANEL